MDTGMPSFVLFLAEALCVQGFFPSFFFQKFEVHLSTTCVFLLESYIKISSCAFFSPHNNLKLFLTFIVVILQNFPKKLFLDKYNECQQTQIMLSCHDEVHLAFQDNKQHYGFFFIPRIMATWCNRNIGSLLQGFQFSSGNQSIIRDHLER